MENESLEFDAVVEEKAEKKKPAKKKAEKKEKCRIVGSSVTVYRTESERAAFGGEWEIVD